MNSVEELIGYYEDVRKRIRKLAELRDRIVNAQDYINLAESQRTDELSQLLQHTNIRKEAEKQIRRELRKQKTILRNSIDKLRSLNETVQLAVNHNLVYREIILFTKEEDLKMGNLEKSIYTHLNETARLVDPMAENGEFDGYNSIRIERVRTSFNVLRSGFLRSPYVLVPNTAELNFDLQQTNLQEQIPYLMVKFNIELPNEKHASSPSWREYGILVILSEHRAKFPGYKVPFIFESDIGDLEVRVSSARDGTPIGDRQAGQYITGMGRFYREHKEIEPGTNLSIRRISGTRYLLDVEDN